jgi:hypothetical protein
MTEINSVAKWSEATLKCTSAVVLSFARTLTPRENVLLCEWHVGCSTPLSECNAEKGGETNMKHIGQTKEVQMAVGSLKAAHRRLAPDYPSPNRSPPQINSAA